MSAREILCLEKVCDIVCGKIEGFFIWIFLVGGKCWIKRVVCTILHGEAS